MKEWLSKLHEYFLDGQPFVVATVVAYHGNSPEKTGVALLHSSIKTHRLTSSDYRYQAMVKTASEMLSQTPSFRTEELTLGKVAGSYNGHCDVIYEYFDAQRYPDWLQKLKTNLHSGVSSTLRREFDITSGIKEVRTEVVQRVDENTGNSRDQHTPNNPANVDCYVQKNAESIQLIRVLRNDTITITLIGDHPVASEIQNQCTYLPIDLLRLSTKDEHFANQTTELTLQAIFQQQIEQGIVIVMTADHEQDYLYCKAALRHLDGDDDLVGCIGSNKKAEIFTHRLIQSGISINQLKKFHMPIGVPEISGKQNSVVAASIIAQIMMQHRW